MARLPRLSVPGLVHHVIQPGLPARPLFTDDRDRAEYLSALHEAAAAHGVAIHAWALAAHEVQLLATPPDARALGLTVQGLGRRYVSAYNRRHGGAGTLWAGRYRAGVLPPGPHELAALLLVDGQPEAVTTAACRTGAAADARISQPAAYWALGNTPFEREAAYRARLEQGLAVGEARRLRAAAWGGWAVGDGVPAAGERPLRPRARGRPARS